MNTDEHDLILSMSSHGINLMILMWFLILFSCLKPDFFGASTCIGLARLKIIAFKMRRILVLVVVHVHALMCARHHSFSNMLSYLCVKFKGGLSELFHIVGVFPFAVDIFAS